MRIHEAAGLAGVTPRAIRFYEEKGLIAPAKIAHNGYRDYTDEDVERLRRIVSFRELGVPVDAVAELLDADRHPARLQARLDSVRSALYEELNELQRRVAAIDSLLDAQEGGFGLTADRVHELAGGLRELRELRGSWRDRWSYDGVAEHFDDAPLPHLPAGLVPRPLYEAALDATADWVDPQPGESGLDLGAGTGNLAVRLASRGAAVMAVEQSPAMLQLLRAKLPNVTARMGNMLSLPVGAERFIFIASTFAMHHLDRRQQEAAFAEMDRALSPGGRLCLTGLMEGGSLSSADRLNSAPGCFPSDPAHVIDWFGRRGYDTVLHCIREPVYLFYAVRAAR